MRMHLVKAVTATLSATAYPVSGFGGSPFFPGSDCVLMVCKDGDFAGGDVTIETDNTTAGTYTNILAASDQDAATTQNPLLFNVTLGDNIRITAASVTAGGFSVYVLGDT